MLRLDGDGPLYLQTYRAIRESILEGRLVAGERLPSTRTLARELGVSRTVTLSAFEQLGAEGYVVSRQGSGTRVASPLPDGLLAVEDSPPRPTLPMVEPRLSRGGLRMLAQDPLSVRPRQRDLPYDFAYGFAPPDPRSKKSWRRILNRAAQTVGLDYAPAQGSPRLQKALARHLERHRGIRCHSHQIVLVSGSQQALDLCARLLLNPGDDVLIEDPHYQGARAVLLAAGAHLIPIPVDEDGLDVAEARRLGVHARLAYVTPSHQFPTGAVMPLARRMALLDWAAACGAFIIEDDYDGEFRYGGRPLEAIQALDARGITIHVGTFSKVMFPSLRLGYVVLPESLVPAFRAAKWLADRHSPSLEQEALSAFLESGLYDRHLRRMRRRHASRREALVDAIRHHLSDRVEVMGTDAGIHLVLWLRGVAAEAVQEVIDRAEGYGVGLYSIAPYYLGCAPQAGLLLGYGSLDELQIREGIARLGLVLDCA
jgi:GntR family transcriptional regulator / MocR family aminotransferase